jgi:cytochrome c oxidase subunit 3
MQALPAAPAAAPQRQMLVGISLAAAAMCMLTGGMLAVWLAQRDRALDLGESWLPSGVVIPEVPANIILISFVAIISFAQWAVWSARRADRGHTVFALTITALVALLVINAQAYIYYEMGLGIADGTYAVMFYALTGMFVLLMIIGVIFSAIALFRFAGGRSDDHDIVTAHAIYWYATAAAFTALWFVVYVTK